MICCAPFFLLQDELKIANQIVGYAYYLLVVGILWKLIQYLMNRSPQTAELKTLDRQP